MYKKFNAAGAELLSISTDSVYNPIYAYEMDLKFLAILCMGDYHKRPKSVLTMAFVGGPSCCPAKVAYHI